MKTKKQRPRKVMRARNRERVNRLRNKQIVPDIIFLLVLIKLGLDEISTPAKMVTRLRLHYSKLTPNPFFPTTDPSATALDMKAVNLNTTITDIEAGDMSKIPHRETLMFESENMVRKLSYDIQNQSNGDEEKIMSAGFDVRKGRSATQPVGQVTDLKTSAIGGGKVKLRWKRLAKSIMNFVEMADNTLPGNWRPIGKTAKSSFVISGLVPGQLYYFRVYGSNNLGDGNTATPESKECYSFLFRVGAQPKGCAFFCLCFPSVAVCKAIRVRNK